MAATLVQSHLLSHCNPIGHSQAFCVKERELLRKVRLPVGGERIAIRLEKSESLGKMWKGSQSWRQRGFVIGTPKGMAADVQEIDRILA